MIPDVIDSGEHLLRDARSSRHPTTTGRNCLPNNGCSRCPRGVRLLGFRSGVPYPDTQDAYETALAQDYGQ
jgi:hypothetical protein